MNHLISRIALLTAVAVSSIAGTGCSANIHDNTVNVDATLDFKVDSTVNVNDVKPGSAVAVTMTATGAALVAPDAQPTSAQAATAAYFKIFLDDTNAEPLLVTAQTSVQVTIPQATPAGPHKLICRLHKHDGTPTDQVHEVDIKVSASASVTVGTDGGV